MAKAKKAADPSGPKTARLRKQVASATQSTPEIETSAVTTKTSTGDTYELIRQRAYELYLQRDANGGGSAEEDWIRAEAEIRGKSA